MENRRSFQSWLPAMCVAVMMLPFASASFAQSTTSPIEVERENSKIDILLKDMTLEEKLGQLTLQWGGQSDDGNPGVRSQAEATLAGEIRSGMCGAFLGAHGAEYTNRLQKVAVEESPHHIPILIGNDVIHGYHTIFPIPLAEACSWDPAIVEMSAHIAASEARSAGTHWTFAPMVDIARDARWGRIAEGAGEDPHLGAILAAARVRGFQGASLAANDSVLACAKHFVAYGAAEGGRDYNTVDISEQTLREIHLPPFRAAVDAGVGSVMSAFNEINGIPATAHPLTLRQILRDEWKFTGFVVSDWSSITEMVTHGYADDAADAAHKSIMAGVDMDMSSSSYRQTLLDKVRSKIISEAIIDEAVRNVLRWKIRLGLFDEPYADSRVEKKRLLCEEHRRIARHVARNSIVLLKNEKNVLPLRPTLKSIAVIGPLAENRPDPLGTWAVVGKPADVVPLLERSVVTILEGLRQRADKNIELLHARGCEITGDNRDGFAEAVKLAKASDLAILVLGESRDMSGEAYCRSTLDLPGAQQALAEAVIATGKPVVVVLLNGRPLSVTWLNDHAAAIVEAWHLGTESGHAVADVLFGDFNPSGRLVTTFPRTVGQIPLYYNHKNTGRPPTSERYTSKYLDVPSTPLYPFGFGLSYTQFKYQNLRIENPRISPTGRLVVKVDLENAGDREGTETVQLYVRDLVAAMTRPVRELKCYRRVTLGPGKTETIMLSVNADQLGYYDRANHYVVEPGQFNLWVGPNAAEGLEAKFEVTGGP